MNGHYKRSVFRGDDCEELLPSNANALHHVNVSLPF